MAPVYFRWEDWASRVMMAAAWLRLMGLLGVKVPLASLSTRTPAR